MRFGTEREIDIYPVGWLDAWQRHRSGHPSALRQQWRYTIIKLKARDWRALKNSLNGYLAEPREWPTGMRRCGSGWTKQRAVRKLQRLIRAAS